MDAPVFLFTPPFTQLNTPYPATAYLKGFLNTKQIPAVQADLGIEVTLAIFCKEGLRDLFAFVAGAAGAGASTADGLSANARRILSLRDDYLQTIDDVVRFLQGKIPTMAHLIAQRNFLPEAGRFAQLDDLAWAFGSMGVQDKAKHLATLYLEDLADLVTECVDPFFGFSRYAERLARSAGSFDPLHTALQGPPTYIDRVLFRLLDAYMETVRPALVAMSVPFPGNLYAALRAGAWIKTHYPGVRIAMGGGFPNTELRSLAEPRVFDFVDFVCLDDGEAPLELLYRHVRGELPVTALKRTWIRKDGAVAFCNDNPIPDYKQAQTGTPNYEGLPLDRYISAIEIANPMHSLWNDGRWNKLTMAHGCYWGKCTFCDISLDYIRLYEPLTAKLLCDRMEELIRTTGQNGFHFVDEAAPPSLMKALALEIIRRRLTVSWWTNIRFERSFTDDLCRLLRASGCIAVSGGLEVASDRLLELIRKGTTVAQVARVCRHFTQNGIMVHAYLMYGFPTQTAQETIDSLEVVRQLFAAGVLRSGFWHLFTMTAHSPVGLDPLSFGVEAAEDTLVAPFANNDIPHRDPRGADHEAFGFGLAKSLLNYMHGACFDYPLQKWFDFKVPSTKISPDYIARLLSEEEYAPTAATAKVVWLGNTPTLRPYTKSKKGNSWEMAELTFEDRRETFHLHVNQPQGAWLASALERISVHQPRISTLQDVKASYESAGLSDFDLFWDNKPVTGLRRLGLLRI
ncbi:MAG TPA: B12-binding domain-containing radical SAM protein [Dinghuibacter sp.]|uniref:B12-binding domain-containing radical SAM protein n=1 Tax=Dinghuibacter sp. TaxID=2024697 RepID=UPI002CAE7526|nr:B12-binding domain-containing radical SAM protein [Dinghuibacter sp.]HTJ14886.1 B12-binding domain-containing radical SAM protein [Dinghuibacter sp.]